MIVPAADAEVLDRIEVGAALSTPAYTEVTFAVTIDGAPFEPIGTDDNAPYRVFYDVSGIAAGTSLCSRRSSTTCRGRSNADKVVDRGRR